MLLNRSRDLRVIHRDDAPAVVEIVAGLVTDVEMQLGRLEVGDHLTHRVDRRLDGIGVLGQQRHADHRLEVRAPHPAQFAVCLDGAVPASRQPAHLLMDRLGTIHADRDHQAADATLQRILDEADGLVAEPAGCRKVEKEKRFAVLLDGRDELIQVTPHEELAACQVYPSELRPPLEKQPDLVGRHLVHALLLPDVAHLAAEVAVIRRDKRHLVRQLRRAHVARHDFLEQAELADGGQRYSPEKNECEKRLMVPERARRVKAESR